MPQSGKMMKWFKHFDLYKDPVKGAEDFESFVAELDDGQILVVGLNDTPVKYSARCFRHVC